TSAYACFHRRNTRTIEGSPICGGAREARHGRSLIAAALWPIEQKERRTVAADRAGEADPTRIDVERAEPGEERRIRVPNGRAGRHGRHASQRPAGTEGAPIEVGRALTRARR
ncbi:hypothetical protein, partial [uncultured Enterovirga sp.]|uniref:hypothetical protein n=1 Tax=uncultured Enterovirga sp. TaxID=2026352 RepID=UPI0035C9B484